MIANLLLINIFLWQSIPRSIYISLCTTQTKRLETLLIAIVEKNCENSFSFLLGHCNCLFLKATHLASYKTLSSSALEDSQVCTFFLTLNVRHSVSDWWVPSPLIQQETAAHICFEGVFPMQGGEPAAAGVWQDGSSATGGRTGGFQPKKSKVSGQSSHYGLGLLLELQVFPKERAWGTVAQHHNNDFITSIFSHTHMCLWPPLSQQWTE